jgi:exonuclease VII large subunit
MKKSVMKTIKLSALLILIVLLAAGCAKEEPKAEELIMGLDDTFAPMGFRDEKLTSYDYEKQLKRGFALVTDRAGNLVKIKNQVQAKDILQIRFADFKIEAETMDIKEV